MLNRLYRYYLNNNGLNYLAQGKPKEAQLEFKKALRSAISDSYIYWTNIGIALDNLGSHQEALEAFAASLKTKPTAHCYHNKAITHTRLQQYSEALDCYNQALRLEGEEWNPSCLSGKLMTLLLMDKIADAVSFCEAVEARLSKKPGINFEDYYSFYINRAEVFRRAGEYDRALKAYDHLFQISQNRTCLTFNGKANLLYFLRRYEESLVCFQAALKVNPTEFDMRSIFTMKSCHHSKYFTPVEGVREAQLRLDEMRAGISGLSEEKSVLQEQKLAIQKRDLMIQNMLSDEKLMAEKIKKLEALVQENEKQNQELEVLAQQLRDEVGNKSVSLTQSTTRQREIQERLEKLQQEHAKLMQVYASKTQELAHQLAEQKQAHSKELVEKNELILKLQQKIQELSGRTPTRVMPPARFFAHGSAQKGVGGAVAIDMPLSDNAPK